MQMCSHGSISLYLQITIAIDVPTLRADLCSAALFNRIIEERIRAGKRGRIGLVNPTLYKNPGVLNDITKGSNGLCVKHLRLLFGKEYGYNCTDGWDPVTGLGTPKYPELLKVFMDLP